MSRESDKLAEILKLTNKLKAVHRSRDIAHKRHELQEYEFEALVQQESAESADIETGRQKLVSAYEYYIDSCLTLRTVSNQTEKQINALMQESRR